MKLKNLLKRQVHVYEYTHTNNRVEWIVANMRVFDAFFYELAHGGFRIAWHNLKRNLNE